MRSEKEILSRLQELTVGLNDDCYLDEGEQAELLTLLWVLDQEDRWHKYLQTGKFI